MAKSSYKKFLKREKAKVMLKNKAKTLLPKGQNVTDLNFKVKKIVIKDQLKNHEEDEILSSRKLNIQEILSRLGHYSANVSGEAVGQLESVLKSGGRSFLSFHLSSVITHLAKLLTSPYSQLRKSAIKLLSSVLSQIDESEWEVICGVVVSYVVCGLSHVDAGIRSDSLLALDILPASSLSVETLLPPLLDVMSTSRSSGSRSLNTHLHSSPTAHRSAVLSRISSVLSKIEIPQKVELAKPDCEIICKEGMAIRVPIKSCFPFNDPLSISEYSTLTSSSQQLDLKEFASSLVPLMLDSFAEIAPVQDGCEPVCILTQEGSRLLVAVADTMVILNDLISDLGSSCSSWMKEKFGDKFYKRVIDKRFPYSEETNKRHRNNLLKVSCAQKTLKLNLCLSFLTLNLTPPSNWNSVIQFLSGLQRGNNCIEEIQILERCLLLCLMQASSKSISNLRESLTRVNRSSPLYKDTFSVLSKLYLSDYNQRQALIGWFEGLIVEMASAEHALFPDSIEFLKAALPITNPSFIFSSNYSTILEKSMKCGEDTFLEVANLLYWVNEWDQNLLNLLNHIIKNHSCEQFIKSHIKNMIMYKCERYPEEYTQKLLKNSNWKMSVPTYLYQQL